jgi:hypothetical protein
MKFLGVGEFELAANYIFSDTNLMIRNKLASSIVYIIILGDSVAIYKLFEVPGGYTSLPINTNWELPPAASIFIMLNDIVTTVKKNKQYFANLEVQRQCSCGKYFRHRHIKEIQFENMCYGCSRKKAKHISVFLEKELPAEIIIIVNMYCVSRKELL